MTFDANYLSLAFEDTHLPERMKIKLTREKIGELKIISGDLVACDPNWITYKAFTQKLPIGEYPVTLTKILESEDVLPDITFATIHIEDALPTYWEMMLVSDQDISQLGEDEYFGYSVDTGIGCFTDLSVAVNLKDKTISEKMFKELVDNMSLPSGPRRRWHEVNYNNGNLIAFNSGWGDGEYPTFAGFSKNKKLVAVVTDFLCIYPYFYDTDDE